MSTEFQRSTEASFAEATRTVGAVTFTFASIPTVEFYGILNAYEADPSGAMGGFAPRYPTTLLCPLAQFVENFDGAHLERELETQTVLLDGRRLRVAQVELDEVAVRLTLAAPGTFR
jgi:hypothetical protein